MDLADGRIGLWEVQAELTEAQRLGVGDEHDDH
jgi:hypothetical protein